MGKTTDTIRLYLNGLRASRSREEILTEVQYLAPNFRSCLQRKKRSENRSEMKVIDLCEVVNSCKLQQSRDAVEKAHEKEPVQGCSVADLRKVVPGIQRYC